MKIAFLSSEESVMDLLDDLKKSIEGKIADAEIELFKERKSIDLVKKISSMGSYDLGAVIVHYKNESPSLKVLLEKISVLEIEGVRLLNMIEHVDPASEPDEIRDEELKKAESILVKEITK